MKPRRKELEKIKSEMQFACKELQDKLNLEPPLNYMEDDVDNLYTELEDGCEAIYPERDRFSEETMKTIKMLRLWPGQVNETEEEPEVQSEIKSEKEEIEEKKGTEATRIKLRGARRLKDIRYIAKTDEYLKDKMKGKLSKFADALTMKEHMYELLDEIDAQEQIEKEKKEYKAKTNQQVKVAQPFIEVIQEMDESWTKAKITNEVYKRIHGVSKSNVARYVSMYLTVFVEFGLLKRIPYTKKFEATPAVKAAMDALEEQKQESNYEGE